MLLLKDLPVDIFTLSLLILLASIIWRLLNTKGWLCYSPTKLNLTILQKCPTIQKDDYRPTIYLQHSLIQTVLATLLPAKKANIHFVVEELMIQGGGHTSLAWASCDQTSDKQKQTKLLVVVIPGLTGSATDGYVKDLVSVLSKAGYRCVVFHPRLNGEKFILPEEGHMDFVRDFKATLDHIRQKEKGIKLFGIGHSFGANLLLNYLGTHPTDNGFIGGVSIANPFNLLLSENKVRGSLIDKFLASALWKILIKSKSELANRVQLNLEEMQSYKSIRDFDKLFSIKAYGYESVDDYYWSISSHRRLKYITIPLFILQAADDPVFEPNSFIKEEIQSNSNILLKMTPKGGHLGWIEGFFSLRRWYLKPTLEYLNALVDINGL